MGDCYLLRTARLGLRRWLPRDVEPFARLNADREVMRYFPRTLSRDETASFVERIEHHFDEHGYGLFAVEELETRELVGFIGFQDATFEAEFTPCTEIGWRLRRRSWGRGYATEGALACLAHGFTSLGLREIVSFTTTRNRRSIAVMKRIGLLYRGEFDHPKLDPASELRRHVLYSITSRQFSREAVPRARRRPPEHRPRRRPGGR